MKAFAHELGPRETIPLPLVFILLFYSGTVIALQNLFPVLEAFYPQTIFASIAILLSVVSFFCGNASLKLERIQKLYAVYCTIAILGLYRSFEVGFLAQGGEIVFNFLKHLVFIVILVSFTRTLSVLIFLRNWILITCALFILHSIKAIYAGNTGLGGRFDNYIGLISNADYIGVFVAVFVVIFFHIALQIRNNKYRLLCFALSIGSLVIMVKTQTRSAILVLSAVLFWWVVIMSTSIIKFFKNMTVFFWVIATAFIVGSFNESLLNPYLDRILTIKQATSTDADFNAKSRLFMWKQGIELGLANPLLGVGSGASTPHLDLNYEGVELQNRMSNVKGFSMHNTFIEIFAERGVIGLVLFCLMLLAAYRNFTAIARYATKHPERQQLEILAAVGRLYLVGYSVGAMFISIEYDWTLFVFLALAVSSQQYMHENELTTPGRGNSMRISAWHHHSNEMEKL